MENGGWSGTQLWDAPARNCSARADGVIARARRSTPLRSGANRDPSDIFHAIVANTLQKPCKFSGWAAVCGQRGGSIRKKIIGHSVCSIFAGFGGGKQVRRSSRMFSLLQKQARQHGGSVFLHPLIKQSGNLLAEIGGMRQARQFKTLQGVPRSREQELPRGLGRTSGHRPPLGDTANITSPVKHVKNTYR